MADRGATPSSVQKLRAGVIAFAVLFVLGLIALQGLAQWNAFAARMRDAETRAGNLALILAEHLKEATAAADAALRQIVVQNRRLGGPRENVEEWRGLLASARSGLAGIGSLTVVDADGIVTASTLPMIVGQSRADQHVFRALKASEADVIVADEPFPSRVDGQVLMPIGRRLADGAGRFQGVVVATLQPALLRDFYRAVDVGRGGAIHLLHPGGKTFFRQPPAASADEAGEAARAILGHYHGGSGSDIAWTMRDRDGAAHVAAHHATPAPVLVVAVTLPRAEILAPWVTQALIGLGTTLALSAALGLAAFQIARHLAARQAAERVLERREREMSVAQSIAGLGAMTVDRAAGAVRLSPQLAAILGLDPGREQVSLDAFLAMVEEPGRAALAQALERCGGGTGSYRLEFRVKDAEGGRRTFWSEGYGQGRDNGGSPEVFAFCQDVTERRQMAQSLVETQKMQAVGHLTGGIAHDFNNLLTIVMGSAEHLVEGLEREPRLRHAAEVVLGAAERGAELTRRLLAFARRQPLAPRQTDVNRLLAGMDGLLRRSLGEHVEVETVHGAGLWTAMVDPIQLETAVLNLAVNARDAMAKGGRLTIETTNAHIDQSYADLNVEVQPGQYVLIAVSDDGGGMTEEVRARAFEPFFTTKEVGQGSGLGLSMVYGFVKQSSGHVKIYSEPGKGTTVKLYLPRALGEGEATVPARAGAAITGGNERVLLVEDNDMVRSFATGQLQALGYRVVAVESGHAALEVLRADTAFDLLFTDIVMPGGMNGRELADIAAQMAPRLKVLFTSGYAENAVVHQGRVEPGVLLLHKPYRRDELATKVRAALTNGNGANGAARRPDA